MTLTNHHQQLRLRIGGLLSLYAFVVRYLGTGIVSSLYMHTNTVVSDVVQACLVMKSGLSWNY
jgi:hypothetical protein